MIRSLIRTSPANQAVARASRALIKPAFLPARPLSVVPTAMAPHPSHEQNLTRNTLFDVSHVTALVTGGGSGIGLMITQALVENGAKVYITGRREEALQTVVEKHNKGPGKIIA